MKHHKKRAGDTHPPSYTKTISSPPECNFSHSSKANPVAKTRGTWHQGKKSFPMNRHILFITLPYSKVSPP